MLAGQLATINEPTEKRLEDTTESDPTMPALAVNSTQTDLERDGAIQHCTAAGRVEEEIQEALVYEGGISTDTVPQRTDVVSDLVADVTGTGIVVAERTAGDGLYPFPYDLVAAQTGAGVTQYEINTAAFARQFSDDELRDTWMVGVDDGEGVSMDYNTRANRDDAPDATVGLGFVLSWQNAVAEGVVYESGYVAIYSAWTAPVFVEFLDDVVLPVAEPVEEAQQATL
jgi:hypothetical protein